MNLLDYFCSTIYDFRAVSGRCLKCYFPLFRFCSEEILIPHSKLILFIDHHDTCTCDPKGANYPACAISLATDEAHHIEQSGNLDSLGDGSSTIPYGSLTQQRLMDRAIADLDVQKKNSRVDNAENGENLAESNYLSLPSFNRFLPQVRTSILIFLFSNLPSFRKTKRRVHDHMVTVILQMSRLLTNCYRRLLAFFTN